MIDGRSQLARMCVDDVDRQLMMLRNSTLQMHVQGRSSVCQAVGWPASSGRHGTRWLAAAGAAVLLRARRTFLSRPGGAHVEWAKEKVSLFVYGHAG